MGGIYIGVYVRLDQIRLSERGWVTFAVLLGVFLAGIEGTVVSTAMPTVVKSIGGLRLYSWVFASYMLFAAVSMPILGKLADLYGRKKLFILGVALFVLGSVLSGLAGSMRQLIFFRAIQGVGGGAMFALPYTILGVVYPPGSRGKAIGYGSAVWGVSSVIGPLLGFLIVSNLGWRWVFYLSVPVGVVAVVLVTKYLEESTGETGHDVDYLGALFLTVAVGSFLLGIHTLTGRSISVTSIGLMGVGVLGFGALYFVEKHSPEPILSPGLFRDRVYVTTNSASFLTSFAVFAALAYVPLYVQSVRGGAGSAALAIFPIAIGWSGTSFLVGRVVDRFGERPFIFAGAGILTGGFTAAVFWTTNTSFPIIGVNMFVVGVGMGMVTIPLLTTIQNHFGDTRMGVATSSQQFFRNLGGTTGVAVLGFVMNQSMTNGLRDIPDVQGISDLQQLLLNAEAPQELAMVMAQGLTTLFAASVFICLLALLVTVYVPPHSSTPK